jgi:membrane protease YdiL (CAAX protease family)
MKVAGVVRFVAYFIVAIALLFALQAVALVPIADALRIPAAFRNALEPRTFIISEILFLIAVVSATGLLGLTERRAFWSYGFQNTGDAPARFFEGVLYGIAAPAIAGLLMIAFGGFRIAGFGLHGSDWIVYPLLWLIAMLLVGFTEELAFRGFPIYSLSSVAGFWPAAVVTTLLFGAAHVSKPGENVVDIASVMFIGLFACFTLWKTGSLWLAAGFHFAFDFMQFFVIGTRNGGQEPLGHLFNATFPGPAWVNGGALGTEASYFMFPVIAALYVVVQLRHPAVREG